MKTFKEFLTELFTSNFTSKMDPDPKNVKNPNDIDEVTFTFKTDSGKPGRVELRRAFGSGGLWTLEFFIGEKQNITGEGESIKIFSTVLNDLKTFINIFKPTELYFSAHKENENNSRSNLYTRMIKTYAKQLGFTFEVSDSKSERSFTLIKESKVIQKEL